MRAAFLTVFILLIGVPAFCFELDDPDYTFDEVIFELQGTDAVSPRAVKQASGPPVHPEGSPPAWTQKSGNAYAAFNAAEVFPEDEGSMEMKLVVLDASGPAGLCDKLESLITVYDASGRAFFSVGVNAREVSVGSYPLHPVAMENVFGGVSFLYGHLLDGELKDGTEFTLCVTWGPDPSGNRVYINGRQVDLEHMEGPRNMGSPGFEPTETLASYMHGFSTGEGVDVGPADRFVVGRIGLPDPDDELGMWPPKAVGIKSVRIVNYNIYRE